MSEALWGAVVGGLLTGLGSLIVSVLIDRRSRNHWLRAKQLEVAEEALGALQNLNRKLIDVARMEPSEATAEGGAWEEHHEAAIRWNSARLAAALVAPAPQVAMLDEIDVEMDRLLDLAIGRKWKSRDFRTERGALGRMTGEYIEQVRCHVGQSPIQIPSIWSWTSSGGAQVPPTGGLLERRTTSTPSPVNPTTTPGNESQRRVVQSEGDSMGAARGEAQ